VRQAIFDNQLGQLAISLATAFDERHSARQDRAIAPQDSVAILLARQWSSSLCRAWSLRRFAPR
jgi:hypothetical protein